MPDPQRVEVLARLAGLLAGQTQTHTLRVAIDGPDAAGKTTLADELATVLRKAGRSVLRASFDDFHRPRRDRHRRGTLSAEGYFRDCFDFHALRRLVLEPLGPHGDGRFQRALMDHRSEVVHEGRAELAPQHAVLLVDGVFLLADELRGSWDLSVMVDISPAEALRRALVRDATLFGSEEAVRERYRQRYLPGQQLYRTAARPDEAADVIIDNEDPTAPLITKWPGLTPGTRDAAGRR